MQQSPPPNPSQQRPAQPTGYAPNMPPYHPPVPRPVPVKRGGPSWLLIGAGITLFGLMAIVAAIVLGLAVLYGSGDILPGVQAAGVDVGGLSEAQASVRLEERWQNRGILLRDGERTWEIDPTQLGLMIDAPATAQAARNRGRSDGSILAGIEALFLGAKIEPRLLVNLDQTAARLEELRPTLELPAKNAGIQLVDGQAQAVPPIQGRSLDIQATLSTFQANPARELADGILDLVMVPVAPAVTDATPLLQEAQSLLSSPLTIDLYDPVRDASQPLMLQPTEWSAWLVASTGSSGLTLTLDSGQLTNYLNGQSAALGEGRGLKVEEAAAQINEALANKQLNPWVRVYHSPTTYTIQGGDTLSSIGYRFGIPYPWIQAANTNISGINPGDQITLPSLDDLLPLPIVRNKRIVVSIPSQQMWAYENGELLWNWPISTGISRSPTSPGVFQIQSHEINAYAAQWNLYMPHFMGVYNPGPGVEVMNGFHGFPTDANGGYLLWTSNLGRPATYGCILLSLENAETLYNWAEEGVVVEIQG